MSYPVLAGRLRQLSRRQSSQDLSVGIFIPTYFYMLAQGAHIYVCGSADKMPRDVAAAFIDVVVQEGCLDQASAAQYVRQLEHKRLYTVEAWS